MSDTANQEEIINIPKSEYSELRLYKTLYILSQQMEQGHIQMLQAKKQLAEIQANKKPQN